MSEYRILNLGAGVQSTALYLKFALGHLSDVPEVAIFADTGDEPRAVYAHLAWLTLWNEANGHRIPILRRSRGRLSDDLRKGVNNTGQSYETTIPAFVRAEDGAALGMSHRQCSKQYKVEVIERAIRRDVIGLAPKQRVSKDTRIIQNIGISLDEAGRALRLQERFKPRLPIWSVRFPLAFELRWTRADCVKFLRNIVPHEVPRSACVFCPYKTDAEWRHTRDVASDWMLAREVDGFLRDRPKDGKQLYVHGSLTALGEVEFKHERQFDMFTTECEGVCGV